jgi:hypothetical protein
VSAVAAELGLPASFLRYWFPELCGQLTAKYRKATKTRSEAHQARQRRRVEEIVRLVRAEGDYPSRRRVNNLLRGESMSLAQPHLLEAYRKALRTE